MPELPEVQTTVNGLNQTIIGLVIKDVWTSYNSPYFKGSDTIKDPVFFRVFKKEIVGRKVVSVTRRAKNILIHLDGSTGGAKNSSAQKNGPTILIHMKMTGHLLFGLYKFKKDSKFKKDPWQPIAPESLKDPFNKHIRLMFTFTNGKYLAFSDMRKFAKVTLVDGDHFGDMNKAGSIHQSEHLRGIGPEPLADDFTFEKFAARLALKPHGKIKLVLLDQAIIAGIGNIYADESLWIAGIHPLEHVENISPKLLRELYKAIIKSLSGGITLGGTSISDYRNIHGEKGKFQGEHNAYQRTGEKCGKSGCKGTIRRIVVGARGTHFCDVHQVLLQRNS